MKLTTINTTKNLGNFSNLQRRSIVIISDQFEERLREAKKNKKWSQIIVPTQIYGIILCIK
jgi:hypothetical protein